MKPIKVTESFKELALLKFHGVLDSYTATEGPLTFKMGLEVLKEEMNEVPRPSINIYPEAYLKMMSLVLNHNQEICWHGTVNRINEYQYDLTDILCYPQTTTAVTVEMDEDTYAVWHMLLSDDTVNTMHMQGHSHVNMSVSPSSTDLSNWEDFRKSLKDDGFYIFCIANKKSEINWWIYDHATNWVYEPTDIDAKVICGDGKYLNDWLNKSLKENVTEQKITSITSSGRTSHYQGYNDSETSYGVDSYYGNASYFDWDAYYDDDELEFADKFETGFRWSTTRKTFVKKKEGPEKKKKQGRKKINGFK